MTTDQLKCPKCDGAMEEGYCLDHSALGGAGQQRWGKSVAFNLTHALNLTVRSGMALATCHG